MIGETISHDAKVIIFDEPSAALTEAEIEELFGKVEIVAVPSLSEEFAFITGEITEQEYREKAERLDGIKSRIRARI